METLTNTEYVLSKELELIKNKRNDINVRLAEINKNWSKELSVIDQKYEPIMAPIKKEIEEADQKIGSLQKELDSVIKKNNWQAALKKGEIDEAFLHSLLVMCDIPERSISDIKLKQTLANGIDIWITTIDSPYTRNKSKLYVAFYNNQPLGVSYRDTPRHAGDTTYPFSFIGGLTDECQLMVKKTFNGSEIEFTVAATFQDWARELKKISGQVVPCFLLSSLPEGLKEGISNKWY